MIDYRYTKKAMEIRGVEFTDAQFSMFLMISVGVDKYDAYMAAIIPNKFDKITADKKDTYTEKCKRDCDILLDPDNPSSSLASLQDQLEIIDCGDY